MSHKCSDKSICMVCKWCACVCVCGHAPMELMTQEEMVAIRKKNMPAMKRHEAPPPKPPHKCVLGIEEPQPMDPRMRERINSLL